MWRMPAEGEVTPEMPAKKKPAKTFVLAAERSWLDVVVRLKQSAHDVLVSTARRLSAHTAANTRRTVWLTTAPGSPL